MTILRCTCGSIKTAQPFRASGEAKWICEKCAPGKLGRGAMPRPVTDLPPTALADALVRAKGKRR